MTKTVGQCFFFEHSSIRILNTLWVHSLQLAALGLEEYRSQNSGEMLRLDIFAVLLTPVF
jgi:hypothetical protein